MIPHCAGPLFQCLRLMFGESPSALCSACERLVKDVATFGSAEPIDKFRATAAAQSRALEIVTAEARDFFPTVEPARRTSGRAPLGKR